MHRAQPVPNRICDEKWKQRTYKIHQMKLKSMKPSIDMSPPKKYNHLSQNLKKQQLEEERFEQIERDNKILLKKMTEIMQKDQFNTLNDVKYKSLNREYRKRELMRITAENQAILKRIQHKQPYYNHLQWEDDRKRNEKYCRNICQYEYILGDSSMRTHRGHNGSHHHRENNNNNEYDDNGRYYDNGDIVEEEEEEEAAKYNNTTNNNNDGYAYDETDAYGVHGTGAGDNHNDDEVIVEESPRPQQQAQQEEERLEESNGEEYPQHHEDESEEQFEVHYEEHAHNVSNADISARNVEQGRQHDEDEDDHAAYREADTGASATTEVEKEEAAPAPDAPEAEEQPTTTTTAGEATTEEEEPQQ